MPDTTRQHPYPVPPYTALVSPFIPSPPEALSQKLGLTSTFGPSAREQLAAAAAEHGAGYVSWVWKRHRRDKPQRASSKWKPFHHGEAKPPLSAPRPQPPASSTQQPHVITFKRGQSNNEKG